MVEKLEVGVETSPLTISPGSRHGACLKDRNAEKMKTRNVLFLHSGQRTIIKRTTCGQGIVLLGLVLHGRTMTCRSGGAGAASGRCAPAGGVAGGEGWMAGVGVLMMVSDRGSGASQKQASKLKFSKQHKDIISLRVL